MSDVESLRRWLRDLAKSLSPREIAAAAGISHGALYPFIAEGATIIPQRTTLRKLAAYQEKRTKADTAVGPASASVHPPRDGVSTPSPVADPNGQTVAVPIMLLAYWRGRVEEQVRTVSGVGNTIAGIGDSLRALQGMLEDATTGMTEFIEGGVFPTVSTLAGRMEDARPGELEAAQALVERFRDVDDSGVIVDTTTKPPARKRGSGGQGPRG
jgi:hypothetical protein